MTKRPQITDEDEFQAFVDGHLAPERRRAVMAYLAALPEEAARMGDYRALNEALHLAYDEVLHEPLPERLEIGRYLRPEGWYHRAHRWLRCDPARLFPRAAAVMVLMLASGTAGWSLHAEYRQSEIETPAMSFARQAAQAHMLYAPDLRHPVEFGAEQADVLLVWLSERLGESVHAPDLQQIGYVLVGGRLLPAAGQPAAQLMYQNLEGKRMTLYLRARWADPLSNAQEGSVSYAMQDSLSMVYWTEGPFAYALIGEMDRGQLFAAAQTIQHQIELPMLPPTPAADQSVKDTT